MLFFKKHLVEFAAGTFFLSFFLLLVAGTATYGSTLVPSEDRSILRKEVVRSNIRSLVACDEVPGLCDKERRLLISRTDTLTLGRLRKEGCKIKHELRNATSVSCPQTVNLQSARSERAFRLDDLVSDHQIQADGVWAQGGSGEGIRVAVLDSGVQADHPELQGNIIAQVDFTGTGLADGLGHGTHVAGIIAGQGMRDFGDNKVKGVSYHTSLMVGKVCQDNGWCLEGDILAGLEWAVRENAQVVNLSLGGGSFKQYCDTDSLASAVNWVVDQGSVVVVAAGNSGEGVASPACASKAIAVGAVNASDVVPAWSSYGEALDLLAPGVDILSAYSCSAVGSCPGAWYAKLSGTSMAAPHVTAAVALLLERHPNISPATGISILTKTAKDLGDVGFDLKDGYGRIDALAAYQLAEILDPIAKQDDKNTCTDVDGDGVDSCNDCQDLDRSIYPGAQEICNKKDDDCNGIVDEICQSKEEDSRRTTCGNGICESTESSGSCAADCINSVPLRATEASNGRAGGAVSENSGQTSESGSSNSGTSNASSQGAAQGGGASAHAAENSAAADHSRGRR